MMAKENCSDVIWDLTILNESKDGFLCMTPNGDTQYLTRSGYENYLKNRKQRHGNLYTNTKSKGENNFLNE